MDAALVVTAIEAISKLIITAAPLVIEAKKNAEPFAEAIFNMIKGGEFTQEDVDNLLAQANALSTQIQSPEFVPPEQSDDV